MQDSSSETWGKCTEGQGTLIIFVLYEIILTSWEIQTAALILCDLFGENQRVNPNLFSEDWNPKIMCQLRDGVTPTKVQS